MLGAPLVIAFGASGTLLACAVATIVLGVVAVVTLFVAR
jgi:hypothetical protein